MSTKLKIKMGHIDFEYEGDSEFKIDAIKELFSHMESLVSAAPQSLFEEVGNFEASTEDDSAVSTAAISAATLNLAPNSVAARIGGKTASELAISAAAYLQFCQGKSSFSRKDLLETMQEATSYYNKNMSSNLSKTITTLVSGKKLNTLNGNMLSLHASQTVALKAKIAE